MPTCGSKFFVIIYSLFTEKSYLCTVKITKLMKKKIITLIMLLAVTLPTLAQGGQHRNRFSHSNTEQYYGLRLGLNVASLSSDDIIMDLDSRTGVAFGGVYGLQLANSTPLWLEAGLYYSEKGGEGTDTEHNKVKCSLNYLQVPIVVKYSFDVYDDLYIDPFLGGYLALGITGKTKNYGSRTSDSSYDTFNRFDGGLRIGCGIEYQMVYAELGFDFGLANISSDDFATTHTQSFFINIGVNF